jgi:hypothetical protein
LSAVLVRAAGFTPPRLRTVGCGVDVVVDGDDDVVVDVDVSFRTVK